MFFKSLATLALIMIVGCNQYTRKSGEKSLVSCGAIMMYDANTTSKIEGGKVTYKSPICLKIETHMASEKHSWTPEKLQKEYKKLPKGGSITYAFSTVLPSYDVSIAVRTKMDRLIGMRDDKRSLANNDNDYETTNYKGSITCYINEPLSDTTSVYIVDNIALTSTKILIVPEE